MKKSSSGSTTDFKLLGAITTGALLLWGIFKVVETKMDTLTKIANFITKMLPVAYDIEKKYGIKPIITLSQSAHESDYGTGSIALKTNNIFSMTDYSGTWAKQGGKVFATPSREFLNNKWVTAPGVPFRVYNDWKASAVNWADMLSQNKKWVNAYASAKLGNLPQYAVDIIHPPTGEGYATDPKYDIYLISVGKTVQDYLDKLRMSV